MKKRALVSASVLAAALLLPGCASQRPWTVEDAYGVPFDSNFENTVLAVVKSQQFGLMAGELRHSEVLGRQELVNNSLFGGKRLEEGRRIYFDGDLAAGLFDINCRLTGQGWEILDTNVDYTRIDTVNWSETPQVIEVERTPDFVPGVIEVLPPDAPITTDEVTGDVIEFDEAPPQNR